MKDSCFVKLANGSALPLARLPEVENRIFRSALMDAVKKEGRTVLSFFAMPEGSQFRLIAVLGNAQEGVFEVGSSLLENNCFSSMAEEVPAFQLFEREIAEQYPIQIENHPWLKPVRNPEQTEFFKMSGEAVHEVAVGPIHAGVIEPGHFRFQCMGEDVHFLEIALGYQHRGAEKLFEGGLSTRQTHLAETVSGDTSAAAAAAWAHVIEALAGMVPSDDALKIRAIAIELERIACHTGDLGALAGDVAFLPTASFCGRIRGEYLNMTAELCGNRFGRGIAVPGGCRTALEKSRAEKILAWIHRVKPELYQALDLMFHSPTVLDRFENTGTVTQEDALRIGLVGMAARACAIDSDARKNFPFAEYASGAPQAEPVDVCGDVMSRARIRYADIKASHAYLEEQLASIPEQGLEAAAPRVEKLLPDHLAVAVTEAWRGALCYTAVTDSNGDLRRVKIVDPSFHNWTGLAFALRGEQISNFPICNKSFNLSYCGYDL